MTTTASMTTTAVDLLDAIRAHLTEFELPALWSVHASIHEPNIEVHLRTDGAPELAAGLLAWADTLTQPTGAAWRVPDGHSIHLSITGRLPDGVSVHVYAGTPLPPTASAATSHPAPGHRWRWPPCASSPPPRR